MAVDVVVVNYHTEPLLFDFIESYKAHRFLGCTLTVIDVETRRPSPIGRDPAVDVYNAFGANIGYGRACNIGAATGENDVILLANADTTLSAGFEECYTALCGRPKCGVLGPRQVDDAGRITAGSIVGSNVHLQQRAWLYPASSNAAVVVDAEVPTVSGSLYFVKRPIWKELTECELFQKVQPGSFGAFLETPHYYEETYASFHARAHDYTCVFYGKVTMTHLWHRSSPLGGVADMKMQQSLEHFRNACQIHDIICE